MEAFGEDGEDTDEFGKKKWKWESCKNLVIAINKLFSKGTEITDDSGNEYNRDKVLTGMLVFIHLLDSKKCDFDMDFFYSGLLKIPSLEKIFQEGNYSGGDYVKEYVKKLIEILEYNAKLDRDAEEREKDFISAVENFLSKFAKEHDSQKEPKDILCLSKFIERVHSASGGKLFENYEISSEVHAAKLIRFARCLSSDDMSIFKNLKSSKEEDKLKPFPSGLRPTFYGLYKDNTFLEYRPGFYAHLIGKYVSWLRTHSNKPIDSTWLKTIEEIIPNDVWESEKKGIRELVYNVMFGEANKYHEIARNFLKNFEVCFEMKDGNFCVDQDTVNIFFKSLVKWNNELKRDHVAKKISGGPVDIENTDGLSSLIWLPTKMKKTTGKPGVSEYIFKPSQKLTIEISHSFANEKVDTDDPDEIVEALVMSRLNDYILNKNMKWKDLLEYMMSLGTDGLDFCFQEEKVLKLLEKQKLIEFMKDKNREAKIKGYTDFSAFFGLIEGEWMKDQHDFLEALINIIQPNCLDPNLFKEIASNLRKRFGAKENRYTLECTLFSKFRYINKKILDTFNPNYLMPICGKDSYMFDHVKFESAFLIEEIEERRSIEMGKIKKGPSAFYKLFDTIIEKKVEDAKKLSKADQKKFILKFIVDHIVDTKVKSDSDEENFRASDSDIAVACVIFGEKTIKEVFDGIEIKYKQEEENKELNQKYLDDFEKKDLKDLRDEFHFSDEDLEGTCWPKNLD